MALGQTITDTREFDIVPKPPFPLAILAVIGIGLLFLFKPTAPKIIVQRGK